MIKLYYDPQTNLFGIYFVRYETFKNCPNCPNSQTFFVHSKKYPMIKGSYRFPPSSLFIHLFKKEEKNAFEYSYFKRNKSIFYRK